MKPPAPEIIDMDVEKLETLLRRAEDASLSAEDLQMIRTVCESYLYLTHLIDQKSTTIARLRKLLFGAQTEKTADVLGRSGAGVLAMLLLGRRKVGAVVPGEPGSGRRGHLVGVTLQLGKVLEWIGAAQLADQAINC